MTKGNKTSQFLMKKIYLLLLLIIGCFRIYAQTPNDSFVRAAAIVDGLFFDKFAPTKSLIPENSATAVLKDPDGNMVMAVYLPKGYVIEESIARMAIPGEHVLHAKKLLRDYQGRTPHPVFGSSDIGVEIGKKFIDFEYRDTEENVWSNEQLKDKVYVINLWQTECGPCRKEMPILSEWKERFPEVVFLSASRHNTEEILPIAKQHNFTWTHLQEAKDLVALVGTQGFPLTIVVDKTGIVRFAKVGASEENQAEAIAVIEELSQD